MNWKDYIVSRKFMSYAFAISFVLFATSAQGGEAIVAVAANFSVPAKEIAAKFHEATGDEVTLSFGPSGEFYSQITQGAPFEVFLSADSERPVKAVADGFAIADSRFTYATGTLVLWSKQPGLIDKAGLVLKTGNFAKIAIADPKPAPYGAAAVETMQRLAVWDALQAKIVQGNSIGQAQLFVASGAADLGFVALSQVINEKGGSRWIVPETLHSPIEQQAVLLKKGATNPVAQKFLTFLKGAVAREIIIRYGYKV